MTANHRGLSTDPDPSLPRLDREPLIRMLGSMGARARELHATLSDYARMILTRMYEDVRKGSHVEFRQNAHRLHGAFIAVHARKLASLCGELEVTEPGDCVAALLVPRLDALGVEMEEVLQLLDILISETLRDGDPGPDDETLS